MFGSWNFEQTPNLNSKNFELKSQATNRYNCIAWAAGCSTRWWWPLGRYYWPKGAPRNVTLEAFVEAFNTLGYEECSDPYLENGFEKVAIYAKLIDGKSVPTHASRQLSNGRWTSKLGEAEDIVHDRVEDVDGPAYGTSVRYLRRLRK